MNVFELFCFFLLELFLYLVLKVVNVDRFCSLMLFLTCFERLWKEIFMYIVSFSQSLVNFEVFICERIDSSGDDPHLVLIQAQILDTVSISHQIFGFGDQGLERHLFILGKIYAQLLELFEYPFSAVGSFIHGSNYLEGTGCFKKSHVDVFFFFGSLHNRRKRLLDEQDIFIVLVAKYSKIMSSTSLVSSLAIETLEVQTLKHLLQNQNIWKYWRLLNKNTQYFFQFAIISNKLVFISVKAKYSQLGRIHMIHQMIYKLFRKEISSRTPQLLALADSQNSQSHFIEEISRLLKLIKKKEDLYLRLLEQSTRSEKPVIDQGSTLYNEYESYVEEGRKIQHSLDNFKRQSFYSSKTYIYTVFMRFREQLELQIRRFRADGNVLIEKRFEEVKNNFVQIYNDCVYQERQSLEVIINFINKNQNSRITPFLPRKTLNLVSITKSKIMQKLRSPSQDNSILRKTLSVEMVKKTEVKLQSIVNKKLIVQELATEKRVQERKKMKPKGPNLLKLYDILNLRPLPLDRSTTYREQLQANMVQRNNFIREQMKAFEKKWLLFTYVKRQRK